MIRGGWRSSAGRSRIRKGRYDKTAKIADLQNRQIVVFANSLNFVPTGTRSDRQNGHNVRFAKSAICRICKITKIGNLKQPTVSNVNLNYICRPWQMLQPAIFTDSDKIPILGNLQTESKSNLIRICGGKIGTLPNLRTATKTNEVGICKIAIVANMWTA